MIIKNPFISLEDAKCLGFEGKRPIVEQLCLLQESSKIILWSKSKTGELVFYTFESRGSEYWNGYRYIYNSKLKPAHYPLCKNEVLKNEKDRDACSHQLDDHWYLEHQYFNMDMSSRDSK